VIEFWSGSNPIGMKEGEMEKQILEKNGNTYEMIATKNRLEIKVIDGKDKGEKVDLVYTPSEQSWNAIKADGEIIKLSSFKDGFYIVYMPDGSEVKMDATTSQQEELALINNQIANYKDCMLAMSH